MLLRIYKCGQVESRNTVIGERRETWNTSSELCF